MQATKPWTTAILMSPKEFVRHGQMLFFQLSNHVVLDDMVVHRGM